MIWPIFFLSIAVLIYFIKGSQKLVHRLLFSGFGFISYIFLVCYGVLNYITDSGINYAVVYHVRWGIAEAGLSEFKTIIYVSVFLLICGFLFFCWLVFKSVKTENRTVFIFLSYLLILFSLVFNPGLLDIYKILSVDDSERADFLRHYVRPHIKSKGESKNLVFIYAESLERTYFDENLFPDLVRGLSELESESVSFTNIKQVAGTEFTIAGMVASQCGIPLFSPSHPNSMSSIDQFLPGALCLGDLLNTQDYHLVYYGGASLVFAGKGKFHSSHKFNEIYGLDELLPKLPGFVARNSWGLFDDSVFHLAFNRFSELAHSGKRFALFVLTLDTHHPTGTPSPSCKEQYQDGSNPILNAVACSDQLITQFIHQIRASPFGEDTVIVVASDHLAMRNTAYDLLEKGKRRNLFMIMAPGDSEPVEIHKTGSTLDISSTLLPFMGFYGVVGLGRNLLNKNPDIDLEIDHIHQNLTNWTSHIYQFWDFPEINQMIKVSPQRSEMKIDDRIFGIPALVELNEKLETTIRFPEPWDVKGLRLVDYREELISRNIPYIWIDTCGNIEDARGRISSFNPFFCILAGKGNRLIYDSTILFDTKFTRADIMRFFDME